MFQRVCGLQKCADSLLWVGWNDDIALVFWRRDDKTTFCRKNLQVTWLRREILRMASDLTWKTRKRQKSCEEKVNICGIWILFSLRVHITCQHIGTELIQINISAVQWGLKLQLLFRLYIMFTLDRTPQQRSRRRWELKEVCLQSEGWTDDICNSFTRPNDF